MTCRLLPALVLLPLAIAISGCTTASQATRALPLVPDIGSGAATPSEESGVLAALNGGIIGPVAGQRFDERDMRKALEAEYRALETAPVGQSVAWTNERSGLSGEVSAAQAYQVGAQNCRQYRHVVQVSGRPVEARGTACRNEDGSWTPLT